MSNYIAAETSDLYDPNTGKWVGVLDRNGKEQEVATPAAVAAALGGTVDANGDLVINIVPRTGTLSQLLPPNTPSGSNGEIAVATDAPMLFLLSGAAGGGRMVAPFDGVKTVTLSGASYGAQTWPCDCGKLVVTQSSGTDSTTDISATISNGYVVGQKLEILLDANLAPATFSLAAANGPITISGGQLITLEWASLVSVGNAWVVRGVATIDPYIGTGAVAKAGAIGLFGGMAGAVDSKVIGNSFAESDAVGAVVLGDGLTIDTPNSLAIGASNTTGKVAYQQISCLHVQTASTAAAELTQDGAAGNGRVNRGVLFPIIAGLYRVEVVLTGRAGAGSTNVWMGTRVIYVRTSSLGAPTIIGSTDTIGTDVAGGVTAPTAITFAAVGSTTRGITVSVTPANTTTTQWQAAVRVVGLE